MLDRALDAARFAPSSGNLQSYQLVVVRDDAQRAALARAAAGQDWIASAPIVLVWLADAHRSEKK